MGYLIGIEIDCSYMKLVYGKTVKNNLILRKSHTVKFDSEVSADGRLTNITEIENQIKLFIDINRIHTKKVAFLLQGTQIITRYTSLPFTNLKEIDNNLSFTLKNYFPQNISNYVMDYKIMAQDTLDNKSYILMTAVPEDMVLDYIKLSENLKLTPQFADIHCNSILRIYQNIVVNEPLYFDTPTLILCIDWEFTNAVILADNVLQFNRVVRFGVANFENQTTFDDKSLSILVSELKKYIDYFDTSRTKEFSEIKSIYITGFFSDNQTIANKIEKYISIPVTLFSNNSWVYEIKDSNNIKNLLSVLGLIFTCRR